VVQKDEKVYYEMELSDQQGTTLRVLRSITQQGTPTRGKRTGTAGASIKTSRRVNVTTKTGYNNTHKETARMIGSSGRHPSKGRV
jgi:hypothetical protein